VTPEAHTALVVGAGPAGGVAAIVLARALGPGSTLIVDRAEWPRHKVCGCCLGRAGIEILDRLCGATAALLDPAGGQDLSAVTIRAGSRSATIDHEGGLAIARDQLDAALIDCAVAEGAEFRARTSARVLRRERDQWIVRLSGADGSVHERPFRLVLIADGIGGSSLADIAELRPRVSRGSWMGAGTVMAPADASPPGGTIALHVGPGGYVGLVRLRGDRVVIGAALDPASARSSGGPLALINTILASCGVRPVLLADASSPGLSDPRVVGTPLLTRCRSSVALPGLLIVGDAAGYVEPFTGEGMTWAIASGVRAAELGVEALHRDALDHLQFLWRREHERLVGRRQIACRAARWIVHRPRAAALAVGAISRFEASSRVAELLSWSLARPYTAVASASQGTTVEGNHR
jgi:flavin-dependent dehydrogenase